jgi:hypothetical protein
VTGRSKTRRRGWGALATVVLVLGVSACAGPVTGPAGSPAPHSVSTTAGSGAGAVILVCTSGTFSNGGIETSSSVAVRVPVGTPVPPGCRES